MTEPDVGLDWEDAPVSNGAVPYYNFDIVNCDSFESLLSDGSGEAIGWKLLVDLAFRRGRVLLQAPAGAGKSTLLAQLGQEIDPSRRIHTEHLGRLRNVRQELGSNQRAEAWLWSIISAYEKEVLLCLDGLDEIPAEAGQRLLIASEQVTRDAPSCGLIITDRSARRSIRLDRWALLALRQATGSTTEPAYKESPYPWQQLSYYKNLSQTVGTTRTPAEMIEKLLRRSLKSASLIREVGSIALQSRLDGSGSLISRDRLTARLSNDQIDLLEGKDLLKRVDRRGYEFAHILLHSYLAARQVADRPKMWDKSNLSALTFNGANFDALGLLLDRVTQAQVDRFVRTVDQWNFYAALYVLSEDYRERRRTTRSLREALLLLAGRRRFSEVPSTRVQVEDALRTHTDHLASGILHASSVGALIGLAKGLRSDEVWWPRWIDIYARQPGSDAHDSDIEALTNPDSLIAWTASNVLLTLRVDKQQRRKVEHIAREATDDGARWRAVHVVGSWTDGEALDLCIDRFIKDKSPWVKNGALRSLILVASKLPSEHQREVAFLRLGELSDILLQNPKWTREIERSVRAEHAPPDWPESVGLLLEELWAESDSIADQDRWRRLSASLRTGWRGATELGSTR